jgi:primosomal protein N'
MQIETVCPHCEKYITVDLDGHIAVCPKGAHAVVARRKCSVCKKSLDVTVTITKEDTATCRN